MHGDVARLVTAFFSVGPAKWQAPAGLDEIATVGSLALFTGLAPRGRTPAYQMPDNLSSQRAIGLAMTFAPK